MSFIILIRNPGSGDLLAVMTGSADEVVAEYESEVVAHAAAARLPACKAWGYEVVEVNLE